MSASVSAIPPVVPPSSLLREAAGDTAAPRRPAPARRPETAQALQPVEQSPRGLDIRLEDAEGRPAGPPPAFEVTILEATQAAMRLPPSPSSARQAGPFEALQTSPALNPAHKGAQMDVKL